MRPWLVAFALAGLAALAIPAEVHAAAARCENTGSFEVWLADFRADASRQGIGAGALAALDGISLDQKVIAADRNQRAFRLSFEEFVASRVDPRLSRARTMLQRHADLFDRIEARYGVPGPVLVAIWAMETDFGTNTGKMATIRSLATLAFDCRRSEMFRAELIAALRLVERGDLSPREMRGAWAGELGQAQFMPSSYLKYAVDFDGDGRRNLIASTPDVLASTANYLKGYGWRRGEPWGEGTANFEAIRGWNKASVVAKAIAHFATRLSE